jgi:hypothetical protein
MAFTNSGVYCNCIAGYMLATAYTAATTDAVVTTATKWKIALHSNSLTQGTAPINYDATSLVWANTNEVSGTGWAAGGVLLSAAASGAASVVPTLAVGTAGALRYDHTNDVAVSGTTLVNARGCIIYNDAVTGPANYADQMLVAVTFGGDFSTTAGIFGIQWSATGIFEIDLTP